MTKITRIGDILNGCEVERENTLALSGLEGQIVQVYAFSFSVEGQEVKPDGTLSWGGEAN